MTDYVEKFWSQVDKRGACWRWLGRQTHQGYGVFYANHDGRKFWRANRFSWYIHNGDSLDGLMVLHTCDNPWCVNPDHLWLGDNDDNMRDKIAKGRHRPGEQHGNAKFTDAQATEIRYSDKSNTELAREYGVHDSCIANIKNGKTYRHLLPNYEPQKRWARH